VPGGGQQLPHGGLESVALRGDDHGQQAARQSEETSLLPGAPDGFHGGEEGRIVLKSLLAHAFSRGGVFERM